MREKLELQYDVFLSHNSKEKPVVRELKRCLTAHKLTVWLDEDELRPGVPWQHLLESGIRTSRSVVVVVGKDGMGPWENEEMHAALILAVNSKRPVIPVLLSGALPRPILPMFLGNRTWVILGPDLNNAAVAQLVWGITGSKPKNTLIDSPIASSQPPSQQRVLCQLSCIERGSNTLHGRNISFLRTLCSKFPQTEFRLSKEEDSSDEIGGPVDMRSVIEMMLGAFHHGDTVILEVSGKLQVMASTFLKIALENLEGYSDDPDATTARISKLIDRASEHLYDPDLDDLEDLVVQSVDKKILSNRPEFRSIAVINDRLHEVSLPMIPLIGKYFGCDLQIGFDLPEQGVFLFSISSKDGYNLDRRIFDLEIQVGTKITVVAHGTRGEEANAAVRNILQSLWQCDHWIRNRARDWNSEVAVAGLLKYAKEMARHYEPAYGHVQSPFISNLISQSVFVNPRDRTFSKRAALRQLTKPHATVYDLKTAEILKRVEEGEAKQTVLARPGFAIAHAAMARSPRISISFGVYPNGVTWSKEDGKVNLVAMVLCAEDTHKTWGDYRKRFGILFRKIPDLQNRLLSTQTSDEFVGVFRNAEFSLARA